MCKFINIHNAYLYFAKLEFPTTERYERVNSDNIYYYRPKSNNSNTLT